MEFGRRLSELLSSLQRNTAGVVEADRILTEVGEQRQASLEAVPPVVRGSAEKLVAEIGAQVEKRRTGIRALFH